jgi:hypothetical protein
MHSETIIETILKLLIVDEKYVEALDIPKADPISNIIPRYPDK